MNAHWSSSDRNMTVTAGAAELPETRAVGTPDAPQRKRVLIVDRDPEVRTGLANLLEGMGYDARVAGDSDEALEIAQHAAPDAALIDIGAPQLDGLGVAHALREIVGRRPLLLIALTGWGQPQYREMALAAGYDVHWVKPVGGDQLNFLLSMTFV